MQLSFARPGFGLEIERLGHLTQLAAKIPAARRLVQEILDPRTPTWRKGLALVVIAHAILQAVESRRSLTGHVETG